MIFTVVALYLFSHLAVFQEVPFHPFWIELLVAAAAAGAGWRARPSVRVEHFLLAAICHLNLQRSLIFASSCFFFLFME